MAEILWRAEAVVVSRLEGTSRQAQGPPVTPVGPPQAPLEELLGAVPKRAASAMGGSGSR